MISDHGTSESRPRRSPCDSSVRLSRSPCGRYPACGRRREHHPSAYWTSASPSTRSRIRSFKLWCHEIDAAPAQESRELLLQPDEGQAWHVAGLEFDQDIDVAVWPEVLTQDGAEQGQPPDVVPPTEVRNLLAVDGDPRAHVPRIPHRARLAFAILALAVQAELSGAWAGTPGRPPRSAPPPQTSPFSETGA